MDKMEYIAKPLWRWLVVVPFGSITAYNLYRQEININARPLIDILDDVHWAVWLLVLLLVVAIIVIEGLWRYKKTPVAIRIDQTLEQTTKKRQQLVDSLKELASENANVKILFTNVKQKSLAETLISIFELAGWQTNLTNVPLDKQQHVYITGTEVLGYNKHLVDGVAEHLAKAGLVNVQPKAEKTQVKPDNRKYSWVQQYIKITIGHQD